MASYPNNVGSNFTVKLAQALNFCSQTLNEGAQWQVAMLSCHYTHNFYNFREAVTLYAMVEKSTEDVTDMDERPAAGCTIVGLTTDSDNLSEDDAALVKTHLLDGAILSPTQLLLRTNQYLFGKVQIQVRHYPNVSAIWDHIVVQINKLFGPRYKLQTQAIVNKDGTVRFSMSNGKALVLFANVPYIAKVLGFDSVATDITVLGEPRRIFKLHKLAAHGTKTPKLDGLQTLYVYVDTLERQHVGDKMVPLLALVDVEKSPGERVGHYCHPPTYLPVCKSYIETITIRICDEYGIDVKFPDDVENVVGRMHVRKRKQGMLF